MSAAPSADDGAELLRRERDAAVAHARAVEHELGSIRGELHRLQRLLWRRTRRQRRLAAVRARLRALTRR